MSWATPQAHRTPAGFRFRLLAGLAVVLLGVPVGVVFARPDMTGLSAPTLVVQKIGDTLAPVDESPGWVVELAQANASPDVRYITGWITTTRDNESLPFIVIDKAAARVYVFDASGRLKGSAAALLGMEQGDASADGVGDRPLSAIRTAQRTTPAGRFPSSISRDLLGQDILWVDYGTALALHRVVKGTSAERRAERLESPSPGDNRISFGCINVPVPFFESVVGPAFKNTNGIVYIIPEMSRVEDMFRPAAPTLQVTAPGSLP